MALRRLHSAVIWIVLVAMSMTGFGFGASANAQEAGSANVPVQNVRVGNVAKVTSELKAGLMGTQRVFYDVLLTQSSMAFSDGLPFSRLWQLYEDRNLDCIVAGTNGPNRGDLFSRNTIRFEMIIFGRRGENLLDRNTVTVGYLATMPRFPLPFVQPIEWYGLRTLDQGVELVRNGRIDALIAHDSMFQDNPYVKPMPFPPVRVVELALQCHNTPNNRAFVAEFDARFDAIARPELGGGSETIDVL